jgi:hypothetical protein
VAGASSYTEWRRAYERWKRHGEANGLVLDPAKRLQYERDAANVPDNIYLSLGSDEQLAKLGLTRAKVKAKDLLRTYDQNRFMTNFPYFLAASAAESDKETVAARAALLEAERMVAVSKPRAIDLYADAIARWRGVLVNYPNFHRGEEGARSDRTEEETYEYMLALIGLLEKSERIETRTKRRIDAIRALVPVDEEGVKANLARDLAEHEAGVIIAAADPRVKQRAGEVATRLAAGLSGAVYASGAAVTRAVVDGEFAWLPDFKFAEKGDVNRWVSEDTKRVVRERLGMTRGSGSMPLPSEAGPAAPAPPGGGGPPGG